MTEIADFIGKNDRYQNLVLLFCCVRGVMLAYNNLGSSFMFPEVDHWCRKPSVLRNMTEEQWKMTAIPMDYGDRYDQCNMYKAHISEDGSVSVDRSILVKCTEWSYDHSVYNPTATEQWNLVCENSFQRSLPQVIYMVGMIPASTVLGALSDRFGRRPLVLGCLLMYIIIEASMAFVPYFWLFCVFRFFVSGTVVGIEIALTLYLEVVDPKIRKWTMIPYAFFWGIGNMLVPLVAYLLPKWNYQLVFGACFYALALPLWGVFHESPRWLMTEQKYGEAKSTLFKIDQLNRKNRYESTKFEKLKETYEAKMESGTGNLKDLFRTKTIVIYTLTSYLFMFVYGIIYYDVSLSTSTFPVSSYLNFVIGGAIEMLAGAASIIVIQFFPRYSSTFVFTAVPAIAYLALIFVPAGSVWAVSVLMFVCRFTIATLMDFILVYQNEKFPTSVRSVAMGSSETVYRIGAAVEPYISQSVTGVPSYIFHAIILLIALMMIIPWPETKDKVLPDVVEELKLRKFFQLKIFRKVKDQIAINH